MVGESRITVLPSNLANMIAAGEVVQRPASAVKELMENSLDAGATKISVNIIDAGRTLIQVIDNGCGMGPQDALLCFERHATSKITSPQDLGRILTFGFRGEALASIAAVSRVNLKTRREEDDTATEVVFEDSALVSQNICTSPKGTNIAVRDLFYNVPARRKFLKSDAVETKHIVEEFIRVALTRIDVAFTLTFDSNVAYQLSASRSLKYRIKDIFSSTLADSLLEISSETSVVKISGFTGLPSSSRKGSSQQFFFVNGRYFRSPLFFKAVQKAYENLIPEGYSPSFFIFLDIDPSQMDVNVHPSKTEIKFEDDAIIFNVIMGALKQAVGMGPLGADIDFTLSPEIVMSDSASGTHAGFVAPPSMGCDPSYNPFKPYKLEAPASHDAFHSARENFDVLFNQIDREQKHHSPLPIGQKYLLSVRGDSVYFINVKRALERVNFENYLSALRLGSLDGELLIFPMEIPMESITAEVFQTRRNLLHDAAFAAEWADGRVVLSAIPSGISHDVASILGVLEDIFSLPDALDVDLRDQCLVRIASSLAYASASGAVGQYLGSETMAKSLVESLFSLTSADFSPAFTFDGRKIYHCISLEDIDRMLARV